MNNTFHTEKEIKYNSQIGLSAWRKFNQWLDEYQSEKVKELTEIIHKKSKQIQ